MPIRPDFTKLDRHVLTWRTGRCSTTRLIPDPNSQVWIATIWPDRQHRDGWGRLVWDRHPSGRGWTIHPLTHLGDVVEFGADSATRPIVGTATCSTPMRLA